MQKIIAIILCIVLAGAIFGCSKNAFSLHTPDSKEEKSTGFTVILFFEKQVN